jgi:hypothetical protein
VGELPARRVARVRGCDRAAGGRGAAVLGRPADGVGPPSRSPPRPRWTPCTGRAWSRRRWR